MGARTRWSGFTAGVVVLLFLPFSFLLPLSCPAGVEPGPGLEPALANSVSWSDQVKASGGAGIG